jgi:hypothetical protein
MFRSRVIAADLFLSVRIIGLTHSVLSFLFFLGAFTSAYSLPLLSLMMDAAYSFVSQSANDAL